MKRILQTVLIWIALALPACADVLVYKGSGVDFIGTDYDSSAGEGCYLILDLEANEMSVITYGLFQHKRHQVLLMNEKMLDVSPVTGLGTRTYTVFSYVLRSTLGGITFADESGFFRGLNASINTIGSPGHYSVLTYPRSLVGVYRYSALSAFGTAYIEHNFSLAYDQAETVTSNNATLTIDSVQANIMATLEAAGYSE